MFELITYFLPVLILTVFVFVQQKIKKNTQNEELITKSEDKKKVKNLFFILFLIFISIAFVTISSFHSYSDYLDSDNTRFDLKILQSCSSPDQKTVATFYELSGGGAAGWVLLRVNLRAVEAPFSEDENIVFELRHVRHVNLSWENDKDLKIEYPESAEIDKMIEMFKGTKIVYEKIKSRQK